MRVGAGVEERVFGEVKRLCYAGLDTKTLRVEALAVLGRVVPFEAYCCFTADPLSGLPTDVVAEGQCALEGRFFLENVYFEDEVNHFEDMARDGRPVALISEGTAGRLERALRQREFRRAKGLEHELRGVFAEGRTIWGGVELSRERGRPDFDAREVALVGRIVPHLCAGLRAAALRVQGAPPVGEDLLGVLTLDRRGKLMGRTRAAERWLGELNPSWNEDSLPFAVYSVATLLRRVLRPGMGPGVVSVPRLCAQTTSGRWLALQADLSESRDGPGEMLVLIQPAGPREVAWINTAVYGLSSREREISDLVVRGASTRQISSSLHISEYTVQDHLSNVFDKVGVRSRRELVKRLYLSTLYA